VNAATQSTTSSTLTGSRVPALASGNRAVGASQLSSGQIPVHLSGTTVPDCECTLAGIDAGTLFLQSERQIPESSAVVVAFNHIQLSGIVAECQPDGPGWMVAIALAASKRRLDERIANGAAGIVGIVENDRTTSVHDCTIINNSTSGLGLRLSFPIETGARICVETGSMMVFGEVRYCHAKQDGQFVAGVLIIDVVPDARTQNKFSVMLNTLRWKLAASIRGRDVPGSRI